MSVFPEIKQILECELGPSVRIKTNVPAKDLTTFALGHSVALLVEPLTIQGLQNLLGLLSSHSLPWRVIGAGSNILLPDSSLDCILIRLGREFSRSFFLGEDELVTDLVIQEFFEGHNYPARGIDDVPSSTPKQDLLDSTSVLAFGAASLMGLSRKLSGLGLSGLEFAAGIPASVGGAVVMNAGAHGSSMAEVVKEIFVINSQGEIQRLSRTNLGFSYRRTVLGTDFVVLAAVFALRVGNITEVLKKRNTCLEYRKRTQPLHLPSAGSVFRNPEQMANVELLREFETSSCISQQDGPPLRTLQSISAGWLLEKLGVKGLRHGGVCFSPMHANWLVKVDEKARASDASALVELAQQKAFDTFKIGLEPEIIRW